VRELKVERVFVGRRNLGLKSWLRRQAYPECLESIWLWSRRFGSEGFVRVDVDGEKKRKGKVSLKSFVVNSQPLWHLYVKQGPKELHQCCTYSKEKSIVKEHVKPQLLFPTTPPPG